MRLSVQDCVGALERLSVGLPVNVSDGEGVREADGVSGHVRDSEMVPERVRLTEGAERLKVTERVRVTLRV